MAVLKKVGRGVASPNTPKRNAFWSSQTSPALNMFILVIVVDFHTQRNILDRRIPTRGRVVAPAEGGTQRPGSGDGVKTTRRRSAACECTRCFRDGNSCGSRTSNEQTRGGERARRQQHHSRHPDASRALDGPSAPRGPTTPIRCIHIQTGRMDERGGLRHDDHPYPGGVPSGPNLPKHGVRARRACWLPLSHTRHSCTPRCARPPLIPPFHPLAPLCAPFVPFSAGSFPGEFHLLRSSAPPGAFFFLW